MIRKAMSIIGTALAVVFICCQCVCASPFLVSDPNSSAIGGFYNIKASTNTTVIVAKHPAEPDGSLKYDLEDIVVGNHSWSIRVGKSDAVWGDTWSTYVPFSFTRPSMGATSITGLEIIK